MGSSIAGAGSIGLLLGSYLSESGMDVTLFDSPCRAGKSFNKSKGYRLH